MKKLSPQDRAELQQLRDRALLTIELVESAESLDSMGQQMRDVVEAQFVKQSLRGLRLAMREIDALTVALPSHQREGLEAVLNARLGVDKEAEREALRAGIAAILQRGSIAGEKERNRLQNYVEMLEATGGDPAEIQAVVQLLAGT
jgi:hypothetical protein